jgi:hypothetical protein
MDDTVEVMIPVAPEAAAVLRDARKRQAVGRVVSRLLRPDQGKALVLDVMERLSADARAKGLTDQMLEEELTAYNAERRS